MVVARKTEKRKTRTRWETKKERRHCYNGVQPFETLKNILTSVRDYWNKLDSWERVVHVGGFGKWESEFQEGSMILITHNVGFIYKNAINDFIILFIKITICRLTFSKSWKKKLIYWIFFLYIWIIYLFICGDFETIHRNSPVPIWYRNISFQLTNWNEFRNGIHNIASRYFIFFSL